MPWICERHPDVGLFKVGDGPEATLSSVSSTLGLDDAVQYVGTRPHQAIAHLLRG